jgi:hypothetical protein
MCHAGLKKSEQRHAAGPGDRHFQAGRIAVYWNSTHLADAIERMAADDGLWIFLFSAERGEVTTGCRGSASVRKTTSRQASDDQVSICPGAQANSQSQMIRDKLGSWGIPQDGFQWTMKR